MIYVREIMKKAADAKAMKKLDNKFRLLSCNRRNEEATKSPDGERLGKPGPRHKPW